MFNSTKLASKPGLMYLKPEWFVCSSANVWGGLYQSIRHLPVSVVQALWLHFISNNSWLCLFYCRKMVMEKGVNLKQKKMWKLLFLIS